MKEAISDAVHSGDSVAVDGFHALISFAAGHEIIRQNFANLTAIRLTPDLVYDQMIEAGCVKKLVFSWAGNPGVGSLHALRRRSQKDSIDRPGTGGVFAFRNGGESSGGECGTSFWPLKNYAGTNIPEVNPSIKTDSMSLYGRRTGYRARASSRCGGHSLSAGGR